MPADVTAVVDHQIDLAAKLFDRRCEHRRVGLVADDHGVLRINALRAGGSYRCRRSVLRANIFARSGEPPRLDAQLRTRTAPALPLFRRRFRVCATCGSSRAERLQRADLRADHARFAAHGPDQPGAIVRLPGGPRPAQGLHRIAVAGSRPLRDANAINVRTVGCVTSEVPALATSTRLNASLSWRDRSSLRRVEPCDHRPMRADHDSDDGSSERSRCPDRRRRLRRAVAGDRAAAGARAVVQGRGRRSGARARRRRPARLGHRRGGAAAVRDHRRLGRGRRRRAADPRHGGHRLAARRRGAADLPDLRRRGRAGRAVRAHDRERPAARRRCWRRRGRMASSCATAAVVEFRRRDPSASMSAAGRRRRSRARLLVAADGARSSIRERAGIATHGWEYGQSSIVTTVRHERDHNGRAEEHFLPAGPFAILPLKRDATGHRSSIVWTEAAARGRAHRRARRCRLPCRAGEALRPASRRDRRGRTAPRVSARAVTSRAPSWPTASRSSATPRM